MMHYELVRKISGWHIAALNEANQREYLLGPFRSRRSAVENEQQIIELVGSAYTRGRSAERSWQEHRKVAG